MNTELLCLTKENIKEVGELFYQDKKNDGYSKMNEVIDNLLEIHKLLTELNVKGKCSQEYLDDFLNVLKQVLSGLDEKDIVLVADTLEYELLEKIDEIEQMIS